MIPRIHFLVLIMRCMLVRLYPIMLLVVVTERVQQSTFKRACPSCGIQITILARLVLVARLVLKRIDTEQTLYGEPGNMRKHTLTLPSTKPSS